MEDASMVISPFTYKNYSLFGIFDGHGGIFRNMQALKLLCLLRNIFHNNFKKIKCLKPENLNKH